MLFCASPPSRVKPLRKQYTPIWRDPVNVRNTYITNKWKGIETVIKFENSKTVENKILFYITLHAINN